MGRLEPNVSSAGPAAITVRENAAMELMNSRSMPGQLDWMKWSEERERRIKEWDEQKERERKAAADAKAADAQLRQDNYPAWYAQQTSVNGCSVPLVSSHWEAQREVCNAHDVAYGRGGGELGRLMADLKLGYDIARQGEVAKAVVTYMGVRTGGIFFYNYRWRQLNTPAEEAAERQAAADQKAAAEAAHRAQLARSNEIIGGALIPARPNGGENAFARQALSDAGITDRGEQDQALQDWFNRDKTDMR